MKITTIIALVLSIIALILVGYSQIGMQKMKKIIGATEQRLNQKMDKLEEEGGQQLIKMGGLLELIEDDLDYLREKKVLPQGFLGIDVADVPEGKSVLIEKVHPGQPAARAGLEKGDIILTYNGYGVLSNNPKGRVPRACPWVNG